MTREELREKMIEEASEMFKTKGHYTCWRLGVIFADQNPKSPWISVDDDLPCNHSDLVLTYNDKPFSTKRVMVVTDVHTLFLCEMKKDDDRGWIWNYPTKDKITHWLPIPEPPKE